ncbi:MAG: hypothetical protein GX345_02045 [Clostridiales bacterium]|nr:hypothetical protein [Clostridiales bacterium]
MKKKTKALLFGLGGIAAAGTAWSIWFKEKMKDPEFNSRVKHKGEAGLKRALLGLNNILPDFPHPSKDEFVSHDFYRGHEEFRDTSKRGSKWKMGYGRYVLTPDDYLEKDYYLGGYLTLPPSTVKVVLDDLCVRAVCLDDGSGRGSAAFAVIDCIGLSSKDVRTIRQLLADFAAENNIVSINISSSHCHSGVDTQGIWGPLPKILKNNVREIKSKNIDRLISGRDPIYMDNLRQKTAQAIKDAFESMKSGKFYYKAIDDIKYARDKREPDVYFKEIVKLHFVPDDGSREIVGAMMAAHPVAIYPKNGELSADYIYYIEEEVNKAGADFIFFQGAQLAIAPDRSFVDGDPNEPDFKEYGRAIGRHLISFESRDEERILPILNIRNKEVFIPSDNYIMTALLNAGIVNNIAVKIGDKATDLMFLTEVGYVELGKTLRLAMVPGEFAPELALGGTYSADESYTGQDWPYPPMKDMIAPDTYMAVIGLCNDSIGYILPDNDYGCILEEKRYEESVSAGSQTGSAVVGAFQAALEDCGRLVE